MATARRAVWHRAGPPGRSDPAWRPGPGPPCWRRDRRRGDPCRTGREARELGRAVLRPGLRVRGHGGLDPPRGRSLVGRRAPRPGGLRAHLLGVGRRGHPDQRAGHVDPGAPHRDVRGRAGRAVHGARRPRRLRRSRPPVRPLVLGRPPGAGVRPVLPRRVADQPVHGEHGHHGPDPGRRRAGRRLGPRRHLGTGRAHRPVHADRAAPPPAGHALRRPAPGRALRPVRADRAGRVGRGDRQLGRAGRAPGRGRRVRRGRGVHGQRRPLVGVLQLRRRRRPPRPGHGPGPARRHPARPLLRPPLADRGDHRRRRGPAGGRRPPRHRPPARRRRAALRGHRAVPGHLRLHPLDDVPPRVDHAAAPRPVPSCSSSFPRPTSRPPPPSSCWRRC